MKIRNGFVSNSSSSSYVIVMKSDEHKQLLKKLHPFFSELVKFVGINKIKLSGEDFDTVSYMTGNMDTFEGCLYYNEGEENSSMVEALKSYAEADDEWEPSDYFDDALEAYNDAVKKNGGAIIEGDC